MPILRLPIDCPRSQSLQPQMQVDIFLLQRGLENRTTCSQTFLQIVSVDCYSELMHTFNTTAAEVQWTANSLLTFYITSQVLKLELCRVMSHNIRAGKYFAGNFSRAKECELNIPSEKYIRIIDLSAELPECRINLPPQTNSIQFNLAFGHFHMNRWGLPRCTNLWTFFCFAPFVFLRSIVLTSLFPLFYVTCEFNRFLHRGWANRWHCWLQYSSPVKEEIIT